MKAFRVIKKILFLKSLYTYFQQLMHKIELLLTTFLQTQQGHLYHLLL